MTDEGFCGIREMNRMNIRAYLSELVRVCSYAGLAASRIQYFHSPPPPTNSPQPTSHIPHPTSHPGVQVEKRKENETSTC